MKKHWLQTFGVFCLGVVTVPGVLTGLRWWWNSDGHAPKFIEIQPADAKAASDIDIFVAEQTSKVDEPTLSMRTSRRPRQLDDEFANFNPPVATPAAKPVQLDFASDVEPSVLAQNSPSRKSPLPPTFEDPGSPFEDFNSVPVTQRTASTNSKAELPDGIESLAEVNLSDEQKAKLTTLREKLAELTKAKAELINEQTLTETIASLEKQISDLHAAQKLLSAQEILKALAEEFPDSPAAAKAKRMLEAAESKKAPKPSPDSFFEEPRRRG